MKYVKDPDSRLDYSIDWSAWLPSGDTITASSFTVTPVAAGGVVIDDSSFNTHTTTVWLTGGKAGTSYTVTNHIVTAQGRADDRSITIAAKDL